MGDLLEMVERAEGIVSNRHGRLKWKKWRIKPDRDGVSLFNSGFSRLEEALRQSFDQEVRVITGYTKGGEKGWKKKTL